MAAKAEPVSTRRRDGTPASSRSRAETPASATAQRRAEEKRVLPVRMRGLGGVGGTGSNVTGKDVEDMIFQCFARTLTAWQQPSEFVPLCLTIQPFISLQSSLQSRQTPEPAWWIDPVPEPPVLPLISPRKRTPHASTSSLPSLSPMKKRRMSTIDAGEDHAFGSTRPRVVMPGFRKATEQDDVVPEEKRKTRGAATANIEDSSDAHYHSLHLKYERYESRARLAERQKLEHERYKLNIKIEYLEGLSDDTWEGAVGRMMQKSRRMRKPETPRSAPNANGHTHSGPRSEETISQVTTGPTSSSPPPAPAPSATETAETLRIQQQEQRYINVMDAGARLLQVISLSDLKRELIKEGKELLQRYDTILIKPKPSDRSQLGTTSRLQGPNHSIVIPERRTAEASSRDSTMTPPPTESLDGVTLKLPQMQEKILAHSIKPSPIKLKIKSIPPASDTMTTKAVRVPRLRLAHPTDRPTIRTRQRHSTHPDQTPLTVGPDSTPLDAPPPAPAYVERYYAPLTESGKPALEEAADKRLVAMDSADRAKEVRAQRAAAAALQSQTGGKTTVPPAPPAEEPRSLRKSRIENMLPFGVAPPRMLGWKMDFDLDGDFWRPLLIERGYDANPQAAPQQSSTTMATSTTQPLTQPSTNDDVDNSRALVLDMDVDHKTNQQESGERMQVDAPDLPQQAHDLDYAMSASVLEDDAAIEDVV